MERRPWLERVAAELDRRGVPAGYRSRLLAELADHVDDLTDEGSTMVDERMGRPETLASAAERCCDGWVRRHPLLVFGLAPIPAAVGLLILAEIGFALAIWAAESSTNWLQNPATRPMAARVLAGSFLFVFRFGFMLPAAVFLGRLAARRGLGWKWLVVAAVELAVFAGCQLPSAVVSDQPGRSYLGHSMILPTDWRQVSLLLREPQFLQTAVPLAVSGVLFARCRRSTAGPVAAV